VPPTVAYRSLELVNKEVNAIPKASGLASGVITVLRPIEIVNFHSTGTAPTICRRQPRRRWRSPLLRCGPSSASVRRRRRELALFKSPRLHSAKLATTIAWQATVAAVFGVLDRNAALGIVGGRELWILFSEASTRYLTPQCPFWP